VHDGYSADVVIELMSSSTEDMENNLEKIVERIKSLETVKGVIRT